MFEGFLEKHLEYMQSVKLACVYYNWPKELWTGIMFFQGQKITSSDFNNWARNFK